MNFLHYMKKHIISNILYRSIYEQSQSDQENKYFFIYPRTRFVIKDYKHKSGELFEEFTSSEGSTLFTLSTQFASNIDKFYLENLEELKNTSNLYKRIDENTIDLNTEKEIIFCTYDEIKKIYNDLYDEFDRELQDPRNNLFITNLLIKYQTNFVTITRNNLKSLNQEAKSQLELFQKHKTINYSDHKKVGIEHYKHIKDLHKEMKESFEKISDIIVSNKIYNLLIQFFLEFRGTLEKLSTINQKQSYNIFSHFRKIRDSQNLQKQIEFSIKFVELASENNILFNSFTYKDHILSPFISIHDYLKFKEGYPNVSFNFNEFKSNCRKIFSNHCGISVLFNSPWIYIDLLRVNNYYYKKIIEEAEKCKFEECLLLVWEWEKYGKETNFRLNYTYLKLFILKKLYEEKLSYDIHNNKIKVMN